MGESSPAANASSTTTSTSPSTTSTRSSILGAGHGYPGLPARATVDFRCSRSTYRSTSTQRSGRATRTRRGARRRFSWCRSISSIDDLIGDTGRRTATGADARTFFIVGRRHAVPDRGRGARHLRAICSSARPAAGWSSPTSATTSSTGVNLYGADSRCTGGFGSAARCGTSACDPSRVPSFVAGYGWHLVGTGRPRLPRAPLRQAHRPQSHGVADRVVGVRGESR